MRYIFENDELLDVYDQIPLLIDLLQEAFITIGEKNEGLIA